MAGEPTMTDEARLKAEADQFRQDMERIHR